MPFPESLPEIQSRIAGSFDDAIEIRALQLEVAAWRERFPTMEYRRMDDLVTLKWPTEGE